MGWKRYLGGLVCAVFAVASVAGASVGESSSSALVRYPQLEPNVAFWRNVFRQYTKRQIVFHDSKRLDVIWSVRDVSAIVDGASSESHQRRAIRDYVKRETTSLAADLRALAAAGSPRNERQRRIAKVLAEKGLRPIAGKLAGRVRAQRGLADDFCNAVARARPLLPQIRTILQRHGVPVELASLPLVESSYRSDANSHAGAAGIWQFTRSTGRRFLHIDHVVDERRDPMAATEAAAKYLRENYETLGTWPLAVTAYNHGANGMAYAVRKLRSRNLAKIVENYSGRTFGFASRNFYAEFLAAVDVMEQADARCGLAGGDGLPAIERVRIDSYVPLAQLARCAGASIERLQELNPALQPDVARGKLYVPKGYMLNLPAGRKASFAVAYAALPAALRHDRQLPYYALHRVGRGETLSHIARAYGTSVRAIAQHNGISDPRRLRSGSVLKIPVAVSRASAAAARPSVIHRVGVGETLSHIGKQYGVAVGALLAANPISDPRRLKAGQVIRVPSPKRSGDVFRTHRVDKGETLSQIAHLYRTTVRVLQRTNGIRDPRKLRYGQVIKVPM